MRQTSADKISYKKKRKKRRSKRQKFKTFSHFIFSSYGVCECNFDEYKKLVSKRQ